MRARFLPLWLLMTVVLLPGCGGDEESAAVVQRAVAIEHGDECHLCGMVISEQPGPKGELYERGASAPRKFCSTRDLFAYLLDPERSHRIETVYVHDMAVTPWDHPDDETFIDAREAWFVAGSDRPGSMGATLGSFSRRDHAQAFVDTYGGRLYRFEEIDLALISEIGL